MSAAKMIRFSLFFCVGKIKILVKQFSNLYQISNLFTFTLYPLSGICLYSLGEADSSITTGMFKWVDSDVLVWKEL